MTRKNRYQALIATYKKRREAAKNELKREYQTRIGRMSYKIKIWAREIRRIEERDKKMEIIANKTREFSGYWVKNSYPAQGKEIVQARRWFFKYCLENKIVRSVDLAEYTGCKLSYTPAKARRALNKVIASDKTEKDLWLRYKAFINNESN